MKGKFVVELATIEQQFLSNPGRFVPVEAENHEEALELAKKQAIEDEEPVWCGDGDGWFTDDEGDQ